ncbi:MAG TPA: hypothetical protein VIL20_01105 [Sandaracinaceae bacterium]
MRWMIAIAACALAACSKEAPPSVDGVGAELPAPPPREVRDPRAELYDENGVPRESDERVAGLPLPRGLTKVEALSDERRHVYTSEMPPSDLLRYFGPRLVTMRIDRRGEAVIYREAVPRGVRGGVVKLDVTIEPTVRHPTRVEIYERPPPPPEGAVIPEEEIRRHFERQLERAE